MKLAMISEERRTSIVNTQRAEFYTACIVYTFSTIALFLPSPILLFLSVVGFGCIDVQIASRRYGRWEFLAYLSHILYRVLGAVVIRVSVGSGTSKFWCDWKSRSNLIGLISYECLAFLCIPLPFLRVHSTPRFVLVSLRFSLFAVRASSFFY